MGRLGDGEGVLEGAGDGEPEGESLAAARQSIYL